MIDHHFWIAMIFAALLVVPRAVSVSNYHNDYYDDAYHLIRGIRYISSNMRQITLNDPPIGEVITAWPLWYEVNKSLHHPPPIVNNPLYEQGRLKAEWLFTQIVKFKAALFLPMVAVVFLWVRRLYGTRSAWLATALVLFEPTVTAHVSTGAVDVLGLEGIVIGCFFTWLYFRSPRWWRLIPACAAIAGALLLKHTAIIFPFVVLAFAILWWGVKPWLARRKARENPEYSDALSNESAPPASPSPASASPPAWRWFALVRRGWRWVFGPAEKIGWVVFFRAVHVLAALALIPYLMWVMSGYEWSKPVLPPKWVAQDHPLVKVLDREMPLGVYVGSLANAMDHGSRGHAAYLFGETRNTGWWYYFPVVASYKVPIGYWLIGFMAVASLWILRPGWEELSLLVPAVAWTIFLIGSGVNIGWRHFLPAYVPILLLATRVLATRGVAVGGVFRSTGIPPVGFSGNPDTGRMPVLQAGFPRGWTIAVVVLALTGAAHAASWHPNYLSYFNFPRNKPYLSISDSNVDWGQAIKQIRRWLQREAKSPRLVQPGRPVYVRYFARDETEALEYFIEKDHLATVLRRSDPLPESGILILSAVWEAGGYDPTKAYMPLWKVKPIATIGGGAVQVYDLDRVDGWREHARSRRATTLPATREFTKEQNDE